MSERFKFMIDRAVWMRGGDGSLLQERRPLRKRKQCCIGIYLTALGVPDDEIREEGDPGGIAMGLAGADTFGDKLRAKLPWPRAADWLVDGFTQGVVNNSKLCNDLIEVNDKDAWEIDDDVREMRIRDLFAQAGVDVEFEGVGLPEGVDE